MSTTAPVPKKEYFENLDGLRFIMAMVVVLSHSDFGKAVQKVVPGDFLKHLVWAAINGGFAVSVFFVLSGFLITYLMFEEQQATSNFSIRNFYVRRILRIWPVYYASLLFSFVIYPVIKAQIGHADLNPHNALYQILFLGNFDNIRVDHAGLYEYSPMMIAINWSVSVEEQFYIFWPLLFLLFRGRKIIYVALTIVLASWVFRYVNTDHSKHIVHTFSVITDLAVGAAMAYLAFYQREKVMRFFKNLPRRAIVMIYCAGAILLMYNNLLYNDKFLDSCSRLIDSLFFAFIIMEQNYAANSFFKFSHAKRISSFGKYTYALYMFHPIGLQAAVLTFRYAGMQHDTSFGNAMLYVLITLVISFALAVASYHLMESKILKLRKYFYKEPAISPGVGA